MRKIWDVWIVRLDFGPDEHGRKLTLTFSFLSGLIRVLTALTLIWAVAAGVQHSARLSGGFAQYFPSNSSLGFWLAPLLAGPVYGAKAFSLSMLVGLSAASVGALLGFLFGVPRPISDLGASPATGPSAPPSTVSGAVGNDTTTLDGSARSRHVTGMQGPGWQASTNLTQVSDWLTKIIVGVGLVEATRIYEKVSTLSSTLGAMLFDGMLGAALVTPALMIAGTIIGFLYAYLFTQLFLAALMSSAAQDVAGAGLTNAISTMLAISRADPALAGSMAAGSGAEPILRPAAPTQAQSSAAGELLSVPLENISEPGSILAWARAQALKRDFNEAAKGYRKLLRFVSTPDLLAEAARILSANNDMSEARRLLDTAIVSRQAVSPDVRSRMVFDAANLALYDPAPEGFTRALALMSDDVLSFDPKGGLHILRACAYAQKYNFERGKLSPEQESALRSKVLEDLRRGLSLNPDNRAWVLYLWDPAAPGKAAKGSPDRDDDLESFYEDPDFRRLLIPFADRPGEAASPPGEPGPPSEEAPAADPPPGQQP